MSVGAISWPLNPALVRGVFRPLWPGLVGAGGPDAWKWWRARMGFT